MAHQPDATHGYDTTSPGDKGSSVQAAASLPIQSRGSFPGAVFVLGRRTFVRERRLWGWTPT